MVTGINDLASDIIHNVLENCDSLNDLSRTIKVSRHIYCAFDQRRRAILTRVTEQHFNFSQTTIARDVLDLLMSKQSQNIGRQLPHKVLEAYTKECRDAYEVWQDSWVRAQLRAWDALEYLGTSYFLDTWSRPFVRGCIDHGKAEATRRMIEAMWRRIEDDHKKAAETAESERASVTVAMERGLVAVLTDIYRWSGVNIDVFPMVRQMFKAERTLQHKDTAKPLIELACQMDKQGARRCNRPHAGILIPLLRERVSREVQCDVNTSASPVATTSLFWHGQLVHYLRRPPHIARCSTAQHTKDTNGFYFQRPAESQRALTEPSSLNEYLQEAVTIQRQSLEIYRKILQTKNREIDGIYLGKTRVLCDLLDTLGDHSESLRVHQEIYDEILASTTEAGKVFGTSRLSAWLYPQASMLARRYALAGRSTDALRVVEDLWRRTLERINNRVHQCRGLKRVPCDSETLYHAKNVAYRLEKLYEELGMGEKLVELRRVANSIWGQRPAEDDDDDLDGRSKDDVRQERGNEEETFQGVQPAALMPWSVRETVVMYVN